jgi:hypothetical protein
MKHVIKTICFALLFICANQANAITTYFNYAHFFSPVDGHFIETYFTVLGNTIQYKKNANNKFQAGAEIAWIFYQNDKIVNAKKYILNSSEIEDSLQKPNFNDVQRFVLPPGEYDLEIVVADKFYPEKQFNSKTKITIENTPAGVFMSDIELIESAVASKTENILNKGGVELTPFQSNFYGDDFDRILFYNEVYNASKVLGVDEKFVVTYHVQDYNTNKELPEFSGFSKQIAKEANSFLGEINITKLLSGNYNILVETRDKTNNVITTQKCFFQRQKIQLIDSTKVDETNMYAQEPGDSNFEFKIKTIDSLVYYIRTFRPISQKSESEIADRLLKEKNEQQLRNYIHTFWDKRNIKNAEYEFHKYNARVKECNAMFSSSQMKGYRTDRGRVYLKYGMPDQRARYENEPSNYPYEIWQYYTINKVHNRKFVFYNPSLASNNYRLLHSDAIGETRNDNWKVELDSRSLTGQKNKMNLDNTNNNNDYMGNQVEDNFNNPR